MTLPAFTLGPHAVSSDSTHSASSGDLPIAILTPVAAEPTVLPNLSTRNRLLGALPSEEFAHLQPYLERVRLEPRQMLFERGAAIRHVYFPETAIVSLVRQLSDGRTVEVGTAGCEGMAGLPLFLGGESSSGCAFVQIPGAALRMDAEVFERVAGDAGCLHRILLRYTQAFLTQVAQTAACNGAHLMEQRCARWLLMTHDRVEGDEFPLTHDFLALMLGVRRAGVTLVMRALQERRLVRHTRGRVEIVDRLGLERTSCECYRVVRADFDQLLAQQVLS